ncbi:MAG: DUF1295 domain-containing protein [Chloroflexi bacterium]|nr:DUF1295 domain-containing protein [Chloroflexota bacterium]
MTALWLLSLAIKDSSIVDIFWGLGFVILAFVYNIFSEDGYALRKTLLTALVTIWGVRLAIYIAWRNLGKGEDYRYRNWREQAGESWWWKSYLRVFILQGIIMLIVSVPLLAAQHSGSPDSLTILDGLAVLIWAIGFAFEAGGDLQMALFKAKPDNKGKVLDSGFWRYTRHPNYFGDAVQWWAYFLVALAAGGWWSIFSPILMTFFLVRVSGVAMLEKTLVESKPKYRDYIKRTSAFVPMPPRQKA